MPPIGSPTFTGLICRSCCAAPRRAALLLRNSGSIAFDDDMEEALRDLSDEFGKTHNDTVRLIVREWMEKNTYLPVHEFDEDSDVDGEA